MNLKSPAMLYREAVDLLVNKQNALYQVVDNHIVEWYETELKQPGHEEILLKYEELEAAEPLRLLRLERDKLLTATDWRMTKDYPYADQLDWEDYRFELRELPQRIANGEVPAPTLDENGMLVFDEWPLKPGENA